MPIEVRHGEPDMAALIALATIVGQGQQQVPEIPRIDIGGVSAGGGGGGRGTRHERVPWHRRAWGGPVTRRAAPTPEEQLQYEAEKMQLQQKAEAEGWEAKYSAKKRQDIAVIEKARQDLKVNPAFSEKEKITGDRALIAQSLGIEKDVIPPDPDKMRFAPGPNGEPRGIGDSWRDEFGNIKTRKPDGEEITQVTYEKTSEGIKQKADDAYKLEQLKQQIAQRKTIQAERAKIAGTLIEVEDEEGVIKRYPTPAEVWARLQVAYPPSMWPEREAGRGVEEPEIPTGVQLEQAQALLRRMREKTNRGEGLFPDEITAVQEAGRVIREYTAGEGS